MYVLGKSSELYKPTNEDLINPIYDTISDGHYDYVNRSSEVKMTSNSAYAVP